MLLRNARVGDAVVDVVVRDGDIAGVSPAGSTNAPRDPTDLDLDGRWLIPGLWDNHTHFDQWALQSSRLDVSAATSAAETAHLIHRAAASASGGIAAADHPLVATGFRDALWPDAPSRALLDDAVDATPAREVIAISGDLHSAWLNSAALTRFGHGDHLTGLLREDDAFAVVSQLNGMTDERADALALLAMDAAARRGIVGIVDYEMVDNGPKWLRRASTTPLGMRVEFGIYRDHLDVAIDRGYRSGDALGESSRVTVGNLKIIIDGSLGTRTAFCFDPYPGEAGTDARGLLTVEPGELFEVLRRAHDSGIAASVHAIGDAANRIALDAFERLGSTLAGNRIEHAQLLAESDLARFATLGIGASVQPDHALDDRDVAERYWKGRTARAFPLRSLIDVGATLLFGSDAPVSPLDPLGTIAAAVTRTRAGREPWHPEQQVTAAEAFATSTRTTVAPGERADLVVLDGDPLSIADRVPVVVATMLAGEFSFRSPELS